MRFLRTYLVPFCALLFGVLCAVAYIYFSQSYRNESPQLKWEQRIADVGAPAAYAEFVNEVKGLSAPKQHTQAHVFGAALYKEDGIAGLSVCDDRFSWGCFHEFIGMAIEERGDSVISYLLNSCKKELPSSPNTCFHAIGHGISAHEGYSVENFNKALAMCDSVPGISESDNSKVECFRGASMEFDLRGMLAMENSLRPLTEDGYFYPCDRLEKDAWQSACYYQLPQWWARTMVADHTTTSATSTYSILGKRCSTIQSTKMRGSCYSGIGYSIAWDLNRAPRKKPAFCNLVSPNTGDQILCKRSVAYYFDRSFHYPAEDACFGLRGVDPDYEICMASAYDKTGPDKVNK